MKMIENGFLSAYALSKGCIEVAEGDENVFLKLWHENSTYYVQSLKSDNTLEDDFKICRDFSSLDEAKRYFLETIDDMGLQRLEPMY